MAVKSVRKRKEKGQDTTFYMLILLKISIFRLKTRKKRLFATMPVPARPLGRLQLEGYQEVKYDEKAPPGPGRDAMRG